MPKIEMYAANLCKVSMYCDYELSELIWVSSFEMPKNELNCVTSAGLIHGIEVV